MLSITKEKRLELLSWLDADGKLIGHLKDAECFSSKVRIVRIQFSNLLARKRKRRKYMKDFFIGSWEKSERREERFFELRRE